MKLWIADSLRRLANSIDPEHTSQYVSIDVLTAVEESLRNTILEKSLDAVAIREDVNKLKKTVENLSLLTGFSRGIQNPGGRK